MNSNVFRALLCFVWLSLFVGVHRYLVCAGRHASRTAGKAIPLSGMNSNVFRILKFCGTFCWLVTGVYPRDTVAFSLNVQVADDSVHGNLTPGSGLLPRTKERQHTEDPYSQ